MGFVACAVLEALKFELGNAVANSFFVVGWRSDWDAVESDKNALVRGEFAHDFGSN